MNSSYLMLTLLLIHRIHVSNNIKLPHSQIGLLSGQQFPQYDSCQHQKDMIIQIISPSPKDIVKQQKQAAIVTKTVDIRQYKIHIWTFIQYLWC